jgi:hypothetical protein
VGYDYLTFTTDYGLVDGFVAACHGVAWTIAPGVRHLDVTHLVPPGDVRRGAAVLAQTAPDLPVAVHVAVVDPGVGTARRGVAVETPRGALVGPDNGLLIPAAEALGGVLRAVELTNPALFRQPVSATFHGRDVFAPVAAHLANGVDLADAGPAVHDLVRLPAPVLRSGAGWLAAEVLTVDHYGNVQLAAGPSDLDALGSAVTVNGITAATGRTFGSVPAGALVTYVDSAGQVALAVNGGSAARLLVATPGDVLRLRAASAAPPSDRKDGP